MNKQKWQKINSNAGYTMIEGLIAMVMVAAIMSAVAPIIAVSVGTRVQARRVELAAQAARSYIDWVRTNPEDNAPEWLAQNPDSTEAPSGVTLSCEGEDKDGKYCGDLGTNGQLFCVDGGDGEGCETGSLTDMIIQAGRYHPNTTDANLGYQLLVRVYRADAFQETSLEKGTEQSTVTNAIGNRRQPVVEMTAEIPPASLEGSFQNICDRLGGGSCE